MIIVFWILPFTWGIAISATSVFVAIAIPMALMLALLLETLNVQPDLSIPTLKCFDKKTMICLKDGTSKKIIDVEPGDELLYDGFVTAKIKVSAKGSTMYNLNDIIVSDTHLVHYKGVWMRVAEHPEATKMKKFDEPYLYCLNTESKTIYINNVLFSDWDELVGDNFERVFNSHSINSSEIHQIFDSGFFKDTQINLFREKSKNVQDIVVGDVLENGEKVYGIVEIDGEKLNEQYQFILGKNTFIKSTSNLIFYDEFEDIASTLTLAQDKKKKITIGREKKLYHLLTDKNTIKIGGIIFCDYNASIDLLLEKE
jgi:hypothetical protein